MSRDTQLELFGEAEDDGDVTGAFDSPDGRSTARKASNEKKKRASKNEKKRAKKKRRRSQSRRQIRFSNPLVPPAPDEQPAPENQPEPENPPEPENQPDPENPPAPDEQPAPENQPEPENPPEPENGPENENDPEQETEERQDNQRQRHPLEDTDEETGEEDDEENQLDSKKKQDNQRKRHRLEDTDEDTDEDADEEDDEEPPVATLGGFNLAEIQNMTASFGKMSKDLTRIRRERDRTKRALAISTQEIETLTRRVRQAESREVQESELSSDEETQNQFPDESSGNNLLGPQRGALSSLDLQVMSGQVAGSADHEKILDSKMTDLETPWEEGTGLPTNASMAQLRQFLNSKYPPTEYVGVRLRAVHFRCFGDNETTSLDMLLHSLREQQRLEQVEVGWRATCDPAFKYKHGGTNGVRSLKNFKKAFLCKLIYACCQGFKDECITPESERSKNPQTMTIREWAIRHPNQWNQRGRYIFRIMMKTFRRVRVHDVLDYHLKGLHDFYCRKLALNGVWSNPYIDNLTTITAKHHNIMKGTMLDLVPFIIRNIIGAKKEALKGLEHHPQKINVATFYWSRKSRRQLTANAIKKRSRDTYTVTVEYTRETVENWYSEAVFHRFP